MGLAAWIILGLISGWLAGLVMKGGGYGLVGDLVIGIIGGFVGGFLAGIVFGLDTALIGIAPASLVTAVTGSVILIALVRSVPGRSPI